MNAKVATLSTLATCVIPFLNPTYSIGGDSDQWNVWVGSEPVGLGLRDHTGALTGVGFNWNWNLGSGSYDRDLAGKFDKLLSAQYGIWFAEISGLAPHGLYDFYLYSDSRAHNTVQDVLFSIAGGGDRGVNSLVRGVHYDTHPVTADADGKLAIKWTQLEGYGFTAWQLTPHFVPEPNALVALAFGIGAFFVRFRTPVLRWRKAASCKL